MFSAPPPLPCGPPFLARCRLPARCPPGPASDFAGPMAEEGMQSSSCPCWACEFSRQPCRQAWPPASSLPLSTICVCLPASPVAEEQGKAGLEEIPAGGVDSRAAGCVPCSQAVSGAPPCRAQDGGCRPPPDCCESGWRSSRSLGPGWGRASPGSSPSINPGRLKLLPSGCSLWTSSRWWRCSGGAFLFPSPPPVKGGSSVCCGNPPEGMWALQLFRNSPLCGASAEQSLPLL